MTATNAKHTHSNSGLASGRRTSDQHGTASDLASFNHAKNHTSCFTCFELTHHALRCSAWFEGIVETETANVWMCTYWKEAWVLSMRHDTLFQRVWYLPTRSIRSRSLDSEGETEIGNDYEKRKVVWISHWHVRVVNIVYTMAGLC